jgi:protein O-mannosyl-transferase
MIESLKRDWRLSTLVCGLLVLLVLAVFGQTAWHDFVNFDDPAYVSENPYTTQGLTQQTIAWSFTSFYSSNWHPLTWLSHALDCQLYGTQSAAGHHLTNVALHAAVAILLFLILWRMTGDLWPSAFVAALFAIHPLRAESVAWVAERKDLLSGLFFMLTLAAYFSYAQRPFSPARYLLVAVLFALGLMAKPMLVTLPFVLLLLDYWPLGRMASPAGNPLKLKHLVAEKIPLFAIAAASCIVTSIAQRQSMAVSECLPFSLRIANALLAYVAYIGQFFYPLGLAAFYPLPDSTLPLWKIIASALLLAGVSAGAWAARRRFPCLLVGWLWYLGMLLPVIGLVQVGDQARADRYTYLPEIGLAIAVTWGIAQLSLSWPHRRWICSVASALVITIFAAIAYQQTSYWRNSETLWTHALRCTERNATAQDNLGVAMTQRGNIPRAIECFQEAIAINPRAADARNCLGVLLAQNERIDEAIGQFQAALQIRPNFVDASKNLAMALTIRKQSLSDPKNSPNHTSLLPHAPETGGKSR